MRKLHLPRPHRHARTPGPTGYPTRFPVPDMKVPWEVPFDGYAPAFFEADEVLLNDRRAKRSGWADPARMNSDDIQALRRGGMLKSFEGRVELGSDGFPRNPFGRTGICGRGALGRWGANFAVDPIVVRWNGYAGYFEMITILRRTGEWALPGGMVDFGESTEHALHRELFEETGAVIPAARRTSIYQGYVDDPRSTDNAWFETTVELFLCEEGPDQEIQLVAGSDACAVRWIPMQPERLVSLYASHGFFALHALRILMSFERKTGTDSLQCFL